jgi:hypothetical protein
LTLAISQELEEKATEHAFTTRDNTEEGKRRKV